MANTTPQTIISGSMPGRKNRISFIAAVPRLVADAFDLECRKSAVTRNAFFRFIFAERNKRAAASS
jgi:hypothetical protein